MLHVKNISELLTQNVHPQLCPAFILLTTTGTLIAYSLPPNFDLFRNLAATISKIWSDYKNRKESTSDSSEDQGSSNARKPLRAVTAELGFYNLVARAVTQDLVLAVVSEVPPRLSLHNSVTFETEQDGGEEDLDMQGELEARDLSLLEIQRRKVKVLAEFLEKELEGEDLSTG